jgi:hypothetical protein
MTGVVEDDYGNETTTYDTPIPLKMNVQPLSGSSDIEEYGSKTSQMQKGMCDYDTFYQQFKEDDVAYLDGVTPTDEIQNGANANYRIYSVRNQNKRIAIYFERLIGK